MIKPVLIVQIVGCVCVGWVARGLLQPCSSNAPPPPAAHPITAPACLACPVCSPPPPGVPPPPPSLPAARGEWAPLPPAPMGKARYPSRDANGNFASARAELRRCVNEVPVNLTGFQCVPNTPPRVVAGLLHMKPSLDAEMMATELAKSAINPKHPTVFIDVGANDGKAVRKLMRVRHLEIFGFEPNPGQLNGLIREVAAEFDLEQRVHLFPLGVGRESGKLTLNLLKGDNAGSSFAYGHKNSAVGHRFEQREVDVVTLDEKVLPAIDPRSMVVMKIDTQGTRRVRYIVAELAPYILCNRGVNPIEILETLNCMGFHCSDLKWMPTRSSNKYAKKCKGTSNDLRSGCGVTSDTEQYFNRWADSTHGYTDIVCERVSGPMVLGGEMYTQGPSLCNDCFCQEHSPASAFEVPRTSFTTSKNDTSNG